MQDILAPRLRASPPMPGYHSEANLQTARRPCKIEALIADNGMRQRDERFATQDRHKAAPDPLHDKAHPRTKATIYQPRDFTYDAEAQDLCLPGRQDAVSQGADS